MKATVIRASHATEKDMLAIYQNKLEEFLTTPVDGKLPVVRFISQSESGAGLRAFASFNPHITATILWE